MNTYFEIPRCEITDTLKEFDRRLCCNGFDYQHFPTKNGVVYQVRKGNGFARFMGMGATLNLMMNFEDNGIEVAFSEGRWADKALAGAAGLLLLWPFAITSAVGCFRQADMKSKLMMFLQASIGKYYEKKDEKNEVAQS